MYFSVCLPAVLGNKSVGEGLATVKEAGFRHYEIWSWWDQELEAYQSMVGQELTLAALCTRMISLTDSSCREAYLKGLAETAEVCHKLGCKTIISQVGQELEGVSRKVQHDSIVAGLRACVPLLQRHGLTLVIEPLNMKIDHPGYYLWSFAEAVQIIDEVGDEHVKVLCDLYHQYVMDDLDMEVILKHLHKIGHFHMAGCPGRHEPLINSEIDYPDILRTIREGGYQGGVGLEYFPVQDEAEGLKILFEQLEA